MTKIRFVMSLSNYVTSGHDVDVSDFAEVLDLMSSLAIRFAVEHHFNEPHTVKSLQAR